MSKNTSILLGDHFENFIDSQIKLGKYTSASEVIRAALRSFEHEELLKEKLIAALEKGEDSGFVENFDRKKLLDHLHSKFVVKE